MGRRLDVPDASAGEKLNALTALRFVAAAMIVAHHLSGSLGIPLFTGHATLGAGVSFFFVLSGFILAYVYGERATHDIRRFYVARFARIWPLHVVTVALLLPYTFGVVLGGGPAAEKGAATLAHLTLTQAWFFLERFNNAFNPVSWSLSVEIFFYALFPPLIWRWRTTWWWKLALVATLVPLFALLHAPDNHIDKQGYGDGFLYTWPPARLFEFTLGIATASVWGWVRTRFVPSRAVATALELGTFALAGGVVLYTFPWSVAIFGKSSVLVIWGASCGIVALPFALLIGIVALERGVVSRVLSARPFVFLGEISFALYLIHFPLIRFVDQHPPLYPAFTRREILAGYLVALALATYLLWAFVEVPARQAILGWYDSRAARKPWPPLSRLLTRRRAVTGCLVAVLLIAEVGWFFAGTALPDLAGRTPTGGGIAHDMYIAGQAAAPDVVVTIRPDVLRGPTIPVIGWVIDQEHAQLARAVFVVVDGRAQYPATYGELRVDVGRYFRNSRYDHAGFSAAIPLADIEPGMHRVRLRVVGAAMHDSYFESKQVTIDVR